MVQEKTMRSLIKEKYDNMSENEKKVAKYVIDNYYQSMLLSSSELASLVGVSDTSVVRYAKSLGFNGFLEYKKKLKKEYVPVQKSFSSLKLIDENSGKDTLNKYIMDLQSSFAEFVNHFERSILDDFAMKIMNCDMLYIIGFGSDEVIAHFLKNYLNIIGVKCKTITEEGLALSEGMLHIGEADTVILSAFPTISKSEKWVCKYASMKKADILLITDSEITAKQLKADVYVSLHETSDTYFNSYVVPMIFCNLLLVRIYEKYTEKVKCALKEYEETLLL